ncbi:MAG: hypothetical protein U1E49_13710 [Hyphomicrobiaceae bacterium]
MQLVRLLMRAVGIVCLAFGALCAWAFYDRYWLWRDCFNELGRCYDSASQEVYLEQAGIVWGTLGALAFGLGLLLLWPRRRR